MPRRDEGIHGLRRAPECHGREDGRVEPVDGNEERRGYLSFGTESSKQG